MTELESSCYNNFMTKIDLGYIAGFVDGEGYIGYLTKKKKYPWIVIANTNREIIGWLIATIGIHCRIQETVNSQYTKKVCYKLIYNGGWAVEVARLLAPYLRIKKDIAIELSKLEVKHYKVKPKSEQNFFFGKFFP